VIKVEGNEIFGAIRYDLAECDVEQSRFIFHKLTLFHIDMK
jgi:hypothetical protein